MSMRFFNFLKKSMRMMLREAVKPLIRTLSEFGLTPYPLLSEFSTFLDPLFSKLSEFSDFLTPSAKQKSRPPPSLAKCPNSFSKNQWLVLCSAGDPRQRGCFLFFYFFFRPSDPFFAKCPNSWFFYPPLFENVRILQNPWPPPPRGRVYSDNVRIRGLTASLKDPPPGQIKRWSLNLPTHYNFSIFHKKKRF